LFIQHVLSYHPKTVLLRPLFAFVVPPSPIVPGTPTLGILRLNLRTLPPGVFLGDDFGDGFGDLLAPTLGEFLMLSFLLLILGLGEKGRRNCARMFKHSTDKKEFVRLSESALLTSPHS
jgi:hypothetical protein